MPDRRANCRARKESVVLPSNADNHAAPKVVHVLEVFGGVETYLRLLLDHWPTRPNFAFVLPREGAFADELRARGHQVRVVAMPRTADPFSVSRSVRRLRRALDDLDPELVHLHSTVAGFYGRLACARRGRRVVYTPHAYLFLGQEGLRRTAVLRAERLLARLCPAHVVATSDSEAARATEEVRVPATSVTSLLNGVELVERRPRSHPGRPLRVGLVGRVSPQKDLATFLRTAARLSQADRRLFTFHFVGVGHYSGDERALAELMRRGSVDPEGFECRSWMPRTELLAWLETCDVVVLTSKYESFGYTLAEASSRGIPVVGTRVDGIRDVVVEGVSGHLVPAGDDAALGRALWRFATDAPHYEAMSAGGLAVARERLDVDRLTARLDGLYASLVGDPALVASPQQVAPAPEQETA